MFLLLLLLVLNWDCIVNVEDKRLKIKTDSYELKRTKTGVEDVGYKNISWRDTTLVIFIIEYNRTVHQTLTKSTPGRGLAGIEGWYTRVPPGEGAAAPWAFPHRKVRGPAPPGRTGPRRRWDCRVVPGERGRGAPLRHDMRGDAPAGGQAICFRVPLG